MADLSQLKRVGERSKKRVGRGQGSGKGKQSGRGGKGQTARAGNKRRPEWRDIIKKLPKRRGYGKNRGRTVIPGAGNYALSVERLEKIFDSGAEISVASLKAHGVAARKGATIKIVGGAASKKFMVKGLKVSGPARAGIEKAGGSITQ